MDLIYSLFHYKYLVQIWQCFYITSLMYVYTHCKLDCANGSSAFILQADADFIVQHGTA